MSSVDERVVEMRFDNKDFEPGAKTTLSTLEKLKQALKFDAETKGLDNLGGAINGLDVSRLTAGVESLQSRFSTLGIVGMRVISNLTDSVMNLASKAIKFLSSGIIQGGYSRASNIENAKFQIQGLGYEWSQLEKQIDFAVKDTAYGLDSAAKAASVLLASQVEITNEFDAQNGKLDQMGIALRAISGVAAQTNSDYDSIAHIFETVAGNGRLMGDQLNQLAYRGMNVAAILGKSFGKTEEQIRKMASNGDISFEMFSKAMYDAFGEHAVKANETFTGSLSNVRAALARIGQAFYTPLIKQNGPLVELFNALRIKINELKNTITGSESPVERLTNIAIKLVGNAKSIIESLNFKKILDSLTKSVITFGNVIEFISGRLANLRVVLRPIKSAFKAAFPTSIFSVIESASQKLAEFSDTFFGIKKRTVNKRPIIDNGDLIPGDTSMTIVETNENVERLTSIFRGLFSALTLGKEAIVSVGKALKPVADYLFDLGLGFFEIASRIGNAITSFVDFAIENDLIGEKIQNVISFVEKLISDFEYITGIDLRLPGSEDLVATFENIVKKVKGYKEQVESFLRDLWFHIKYIFGLEDVELSTDDLKKAFEDVVGFFETSWGNIKNTLSTIKWFIRAIHDGFEELTGIDVHIPSVNDLKFAIEDIKEKVDSLKTSFINAKNKISSKLSELRYEFKELTGIDVHIPTLGDVLSTIRSIFNYLAGVKNKVSTFLTENQGIKDFVQAVKDAFSGFDVDLSGFNLFVDGVSEKLGPVEKILNVISYVISFIFHLASQAIPVIKTVANQIIQWAKELWEGIKTLLNGDSDFGNALKNTTLGVVIYQITRALIQINKLLGRGGGNQKFNPILAAQYAFNQLFDTLFNIERAIRVGYFIAVGIALLLIAKAIDTLASIDTSKMITGLGAIYILFKLLNIGMLKISKASLLTDNTFYQTALVLFALASAISIISKSIKTLAQLKFGELMQGLFGITVLLGELTIVARKLSGADNMMKGLGGLLVMAVSVKILASAIKSLAKLDLISMALSFAAISVLLIELTGIAATLSGADKMMKGLSGLLIMAVAVKILSSAIKTLAKLDMVSMVVGFAVISALLIELTGIATTLSGASSMAKGLSGLLTMAVSVKTLATAIKTLSKLDTASMLLSFMVVSALMQELSMMAIKMQGVKGGMAAAASGFLIMSIALIAISGALRILGAMSLTEMLIALGGLSTAMVVLAMAMNAVQNAAKGAAALLIVSAALIPLALALKLLSTINIIAMFASLAGLATTMLILGVAAFALEPLIPAIIGLSGGFLLFAAASALLGVALMAVAAGLAASGPALDVFITGLMSGLYQLVKGLGDAGAELIIAVARILIALFEGIRDAAPALKDAVVSLFLSVGQALLEILPAFVALGVLVITAFLEGLARNIKRIVVAAVTLIVNFLDGIAQMMPTIMLAGMTLMVSFVNSLAEGLRQSGGDLLAAVRNLLSAVIEFCISALQELLKGLPGVGNKINDALEKAKQTVREKLAPEDGKQAGEEYSGSVAEGIQNGSEDIEEAARSSGRGGAEALESELSGTGEIGASAMENLGSGMAGESVGVFELSDEAGRRVLEGLDISDESGLVGEGGINAYLSAYQGADGFALGEDLSGDLLNGIHENDEGFFEAGDIQQGLYNESIEEGFLPAEENGAKLSASTRKAAFKEAQMMKEPGNAAVENYNEGIEEALPDAENFGGDIAAYAAQGAVDESEELKESGKSGASIYNSSLESEAKANTAKSGAKLPEEAAKGADNNKSKMKSPAVQSAIEFANSLDDKNPLIRSKGASMGQAGVDGAGSKKGDFKTTGIFYAYGVGDGMVSGDALSYIRQKAWRMAKEAKLAAERALQEKSPSQVGYQIGAYFTIGLANGIEALATKVRDASTNMSEEAENGIAYTARTIAGLVSDGIEFEPVIRPVLDASEIQNGLGAVDGLLTTQRSMALTAGVSFRNNQTQTIEQQITNAVDKAVNGIYEKISAAEAKRPITVNVPLTIDKRQFARATATVNREELDRIDYFTNRKAGIA